MQNHQVFQTHCGKLNTCTIPNSLPANLEYKKELGLHFTVFGALFQETRHGQLAECKNTLVLVKLHSWWLDNLQNELSKLKKTSMAVDNLTQHSLVININDH